MSSATADGYKRLRIVRCPTCGGDSRFDATNPSRPFCSPRCKSADLGAWASEQYRVAGPDAHDVPAPGGGEDGDSDTEPGTLARS